MKCDSMKGMASKYNRRYYVKMNHYFWGHLKATTRMLDIIKYFTQWKLWKAIHKAHNHPSGNLKPSDSDINLTKRLKEAGKVLEIAVLDHIIVAHHQYFSFADEGLI
jgi:DNA repair protein RadC